MVKVTKFADSTVKSQSSYLHDEKFTLFISSPMATLFGHPASLLDLKIQVQKRTIHSYILVCYKENNLHEEGSAFLNITLNGTSLRAKLLWPSTI